MRQRSTIIVVGLLVATVAAVGCDLLLKPFTKGHPFETDTDEGDSGLPDGGDDYCPGFIPTGSDWDLCCTADNLCGVEEDGECDCQGSCDWDQIDCEVDTAPSPCPAWTEGYECVSLALCTGTLAGVADDEMACTDPSQVCCQLPEEIDTETATDVDPDSGT